VARWPIVLGLIVILGTFGAGGWWLFVDQPAEPPASLPEVLTAELQQEGQARQAAAEAKAQQEEQARQAAAEAKAQQEERDRQAAAAAKAQVADALKTKPDIRGSVSAVESASRIRVGDTWLDLYGVSDPTRRAHTRQVLGYLQPSQGAVECYQKIGGRYQCYADGKDLALLALRDGLALAAADAPEEYRSVSPKKKSARH
jgi:hypothetical protein